LQDENIRSQLEAILEQAKEIDKREWEEFLSAGRTVVNCQACNGKGYKLKYAGCNCVRDNPYDRIHCTSCKGQGKVIVEVKNQSPNTL